MAQAQASMKEVLMWVFCIMLVAGLLLPLTYLIPPVDLAGPLAQAAYWISESGGTLGTPIITIALIGVLLGRAGLTWKQRGGVFLVIVLSLATLFGGAAYLNEFVVKPYFEVSRPNIVELAGISEGSSILKKSASEFYAMPNKAVRSEYLKEILLLQTALPMHEHVRQHWIHETGYSFPSGHSFSAMLVATVFLGLGLTDCSGRRRWIFFLPVAWAVAVCFSRPILRVHSATDVCVGGLEGILIGMAAFLLVRWVLFKLGSAECEPSRKGATDGTSALRGPTSALGRADETSAAT